MKLACPLRQVKLHIFVHQEGDPGGGQDPHDTGHDSAVEAPPPFLLPRPPDDAPDTPPKPRVSVVVLQPAPDHLVWVRDGAGDQLRDAGDGDGGFIADPLLAGVKRGSPCATRKVQPLQRIIHCELDGSVGDPE